jgi:hypothetical protein
MLVLPDNPNFEPIKNFGCHNINKVINFLKWKRCKVRINPIEVDCLTAHEILKFGICSFGFQKKENRFIVWKSSVKWKIYAELFLEEKVTIFDILQMLRSNLKSKLSRIIDVC